jgi:hypothetical protein
MKRTTRNAKLDDGSEPPEDHPMEARNEKMEQDVAAMKIDLAVIKATCATRTDLAELASSVKSTIAETRSALVLWIVSVVFLGQLLPGLIRLIEAHL